MEYKRRVEAGQEKKSSRGTREESKDKGQEKRKSKCPRTVLCIVYLQANGKNDWEHGTGA